VKTASGATAVQVVWASRRAREHWASRLGARRAGTGVAEGGGAAAGGGRARLHPALALARRPLLEAAGLAFSVAVSSYG